MKSGEAFPPAHWEMNKLLEEYARSMEAYMEICTVTPEQDMDTFDRADELLADAQDIRDRLWTMGYSVMGSMLP